MRDDLVEIIAAMIERRGQIAAEEPVENAGAAHQGQRRTHQPPRAFENQNRKQGADHKIEPRRIAVARDQVGVEYPLIEPAQKPRAADQPTGRAADIAFGGKISDQAEGHQDQEADVNAAHHLARQHVPCRDDQLKGRERDADGIGQMSPAARAETFRESVLEIVEFNLGGDLNAFGLQHLRNSPALKSSALKFGSGPAQDAPYADLKLAHPSKMKFTKKMVGRG